MKTIGAYEAKTNLSRLLREVTRGESIKITRNGIPVAMLVPVHSEGKSEAKQVIAQIHSFRKGKKLGDLSIGELIKEGRRF